MRATRDAGMLDVLHRQHQRGGRLALRDRADDAGGFGDPAPLAA